MGRIALYLPAGTLLTLMLQMSALYLGPAGILLHLFVPLPAAHGFMRHGWGAGGGIVALTTASLLVVTSPAGAGAYFAQFGLGSLILPLLLRRGKGWDTAVTGAVAASAGGALLAAAAYAAARGVAVGELIGRFVRSEVDQAIALYQKAELPQEQIEELKTVAEGMADFLVLAWPGLAIVATGGIFLLTVRFLSAFSAGRYEVPGVPFSDWKAPELLVWVLIVSGSGALLGNGWPYRISVNVLTVVLPVYFLQGLAVVTWFFRKRNVSPLFRSLGYLLAVALNPLPLIVMGMGIFDLWVDFRKSGIRKT